MKKFVVLPALALAAVAVAHPACAASSKKSAATPAAAPATPQWATMPAGKAHMLRHAYPIRSQDKPNWPTKKAVTLKKGSSDPSCLWDRPSPNLDGAKLVVTDNSGTLALQLIYATGVIVQRTLTEGTFQGDLTFLYSTPSDDWNYYVLLKDTKKGAPEQTPIDKWYEIEIFPPKNFSARCDGERPDAAITVARVGDTATRFCETSTGGGGEPH